MSGALDDRYRTVDLKKIIQLGRPHREIYKARAQCKYFSMVHLPVHILIRQVGIDASQNISSATEFKLQLQSK